MKDVVEIFKCLDLILVYDKFKMIKCFHKYQVESRFVRGIVAERSSHSGVTKDSLLERGGGVVEHSVAVV